jgi:MOSC domain-containing protein YiiM
LIGERWRIGDAEFEVTQPREPCWKLGVKMEDRTFPNRFSEGNRPGAYLSIVKEGYLEKCDIVEIIDRPAHPVTIGLLAYLMYTDHRTAALLTEMFGQDLTREEWREFLQPRLRSKPSG